MKSHSNPDNKKIQICQGKSCSDNFSHFLADRANAELEGKESDIEIEMTGCQGNCKCAPNVKLQKNGREQKIEKITGAKLAHAMKQFFNI